MTSEKIELFARQMERMAEKQSEWEGRDPRPIMGVLYEAFGELEDAIQWERTAGAKPIYCREVVEKAAEVACLAMMVADVCGVLEEGLDCDEGGNDGEKD